MPTVDSRNMPVRDGAKIAASDTSPLQWQYSSETMMTGRPCDFASRASFCDSVAVLAPDVYAFQNAGDDGCVGRWPANSERFELFDQRGFGKRLWRTGLAGNQRL